MLEDHDVTEVIAAVERVRQNLKQLLPGQAPEPANQKPEAADQQAVQGSQDTH